MKREPHVQQLTLDLSVSGASGEIRLGRYRNSIHISYAASGRPQETFSVCTKVVSTDTAVTLAGARTIITGTQPNGSAAGAITIEFDTSEVIAEVVYTKTSGTGTATISHAAKD